MDSNTLAALRGTLTSPDIDYNNTSKWTVTNNLAAGIHGWIVSSAGVLMDSGVSLSGGTQNAQSPFPFPDKCFVIWKELISNAFICVQFIDYKATGATFAIAPDALLQPGDIGPVPQPTATTLIPQDSPAVVVGCGAMVGGCLVRYQYWHCSSDSYSLPPNDKRTYTVTTTSGMSDTTTDQQTVSQQVNTSASGGWGPISASVSYSLSTSSTTMHSYTITEQTTRYDSLELKNEGTKVATYFSWQLMDVIDIYVNVNNVTVPSGSIVSGRVPKIYDGPHYPLLHKEVQMPRLTSVEAAMVEQWRRPLRAIPTAQFGNQ